MSKSPFLSVVVAGLLAGVAAQAAQVRIPVNTADSTLFLRLCANPGGLGTDCDDDISPITGFVTVALDDNLNPTQIALRNFDLQATEPYDLYLAWLLFDAANLTATASNLRLYHSQPGTANPRVPLTMGTNFTFTGVPFRTAGNANYRINDLACTFVTGFPCSSNIDLATLGENNIDSLPGSFRIDNGVIYIALDFTFTTPLDDTNPDLGVFSGVARVRGSAPISLSMVPRGSDWKYLDDGSNQGAAYTLPPPQFDDSPWRLGVAQLGYGDGDETTVLSYGPDPANKPITTYYRHHFNVEDPFTFTNAALRVLSDDGVIVYLNGTEIYRANMPPDPFPPFTELATVAVGGAAESVFFTAPPVDPGLFYLGPNLLAAEIHQASAGSSDISFDLEMISNGLFINTPPSIAITSPTNGASFSGNSITLQATATDIDGLISLVEFYEGATKIGEATGAGPDYSFTWPNACAGAYVFTAHATDNEGVVAVSAPVVVAVTRPPVSLISQSAVWKYLDTGANLGTAWRSNSFNDAAWPGGPAQLGFGDFDEATTIASNRQVTTYFRRVFNVASAAGVAAINLRLLRDDGAVVYLNGAEVYRNNMPAGTINFDTLAPAGATAAEETTFFFTASVTNLGLLASGNNLVAVEVHQNATTSSDLSFDFSLEATFTNRPPTGVAITTPANNSIRPLGADITFRANATDADGLVRRVEYYAGSNKIGQATSAPYTFVWNDAPAGVHVLTARAYDDCDAVSTSAAVLVRVGAFTMIPPGALWRYRDTGSDQGTAWRARNFANHFVWAEAPARFGYGGDGEVTTLAKTNATTGTTNITFYFRRFFPVPDPTIITGIVVRLLRDDGAVGYINGIEIFRSNMPTGAINYLTTAPTAVGGTDEQTFFIDSFDNDVLLPGTNILAVEIHQQSITSSDVSFDLELLGLVGEVHPRLFITPGAGVHTLRWPSAAAGFRLQFTSNIGMPSSWQDYPGTPADDGAMKTLTLPSSQPAVFYRLSQ